MQASIQYAASPWTLTSSFGGPDQRFSRVGAERFTLTVACQGMSQDQGSEIATLVACGMTDLVRMSVPQPEVTLPADGSVVSGSGASLVVSGTSPAPGRYFSLEHGGVHYLHRVVTASGGTLTIQPPLKVVPTPGDTCHFQDPQIEGFVADNSVSVEFGLTGVIKSLSFAVREAQ